MYATPEDECCLNFKFTIMPDPDNPADQVAVAEFESQLETAIDEEGQLYDIVKAANPETFITGLGSPGKGGDGDREVDASTGGGGEEEDSAARKRILDSGKVKKRTWIPHEVNVAI